MLPYVYPEMQRLLYTLVCLLWLYSASVAQVGSPFDLQARLDSTIRTENIVSTPAAPEVAQPRARNPFNLDRQPTAQHEQRQPDVASTTPSPPRETADREAVAQQTNRGQFDVVTVAVLILLFALTFVLQGNTLEKMWGAIRNDNLLSRLQREQRWGGYLVWAFLGALSTGVFVFVAVRQLYPAAVSDWGWSMLDKFVLFAVGIVVAKLLILSFLRYVFPLADTIDSYRTAIIVWLGILGTTLLPITVFVAFGSPVLAKALAYAGLGLIAIVLLLRALRVIASNSRTLTGYPLHFFLYLCALEIGPLAVAYKLLNG